MEQKKEYIAFISYTREDEDWAKWLVHELEHYHLPLTNGRDDLPKDLRPIFRDIDELSAGNLPQQIHQALEKSKNLIVICSPRSANSPWVNKEVEEFISMGKMDCIFPFIIEGVPKAKHEKDECLPKAIRVLKDDNERLGANVSEYKDRPLRLCTDCPLPKESNKKQGNINEKGRDAAVVKIVAGMFDLSFDTLWQRYEREKAEEERKIREQRDKLLIMQSRLLAEKANQLIEEGDSYTARLLALEALPKNLQNLDRPYVAEAEQVLREANQYDRMIMNHSYSVSIATFSPDDKIIATASNDFSIYLWDAKTGKLIRKLNGNIDDINSLSFSPNGELLVSSSGHIWSRARSNQPMDFSIRIWNVNTGEEIHELVGHSRKVKNACFCNNGEWIISDSSDGTVRIWEVSTGKELKKYDNLMTLDSSSGLFLLKHVDSVLSFWRPEAPLIKYKMYWHEEETPRLFSPQTNTIVSTSHNSTKGYESINLWDVNTGKKLLSLEGHTSSVESFSFSPDGKQLILGSIDKTIRIWDTTNGKEIKCFNISSWGKSVNFSHDGKSVVYGNDNIVYFRNLTNKYEISRINSGTISVDSVNFSPNGDKYIVSAGRNLKIFDVIKKEEILRIKGYKCRASTAKYSSDGKWIVASLDNETIKIWDALTGKEKQTINECGIFSFAIINNAQVLIVMLYKSIHIWDIEKGKLIRSIEKTDINNISMTVHANCMLIAATQEGNHQIRFWEIETGKEINRITVDFGFAKAISFHPDGKLVACASTNFHIHVMDVKTGKDNRMFEGHTGYVNSIAFSNDGKYLLSSSDDKTIRIWDIDSGNEILQMVGHTNFVTDVTFNPKNNMIASVSSDESIRLWSLLPLKELIDKTRERFINRQLTPEERKKYYID